MNATLWKLSAPTTEIVPIVIFDVADVPSDLIVYWAYPGVNVDPTFVGAYIVNAFIVKLTLVAAGPEPVDTSINPIL